MDDTRFVDFLCWHLAERASRLYPVTEKAEACMDSLPDDRYEEGSIEEAEAYGWELGEHSRAITDAREAFRQVEKKAGDDPVERARRYAEYLRENQNLTQEELSDPSFEWWEK